MEKAMVDVFIRRCVAIVLLSWMAFGAAAAWAQVTVEDFLQRAHAEEYGQLSPAGKRQVRSFAADIWVPLQNIYAEQRVRRGCSPEKDMDAQYQRLKESAGALNARYSSRRRELEASLSEPDRSLSNRIFIPPAPPAPICPPNKR